MSEVKDLKLTVYRSNQRHDIGWFRTWLVMFRNVIASRELIYELFKRDFLAGYKKSFIGHAWIFLSPLAGIVSWVFLQMSGILNPGELGIPYPVYVLVGTSMWGLFQGFYNASSATLTAGGGLLTQIKYPHEALLFKQCAEQLSSFTISFLMNLMVMVIFGVVPSWKAVLLPAIILPLFLLASSIGLISAMISVVAVDVKSVINMGMGLMIWVTPIIYSDKIDNEWIRLLIKWNPLTYLVCSARDIVLYGRLYDATGFWICFGISVFAFLLAWRLFYVSEDRIIERMV